VGTRWVQFKRKACSVLIRSFPIIVGHMENLAETASKAEDKAKVKGYLATLKKFSFVATLLFFAELLEPLAKLSLCLQGDSIDLIHARSALDRYHTCLSRQTCGDENEVGSSLSKLLNSAKEYSDDSQQLEYRGVHLTHIPQGMKTFEEKKQQLVNKLKEAMSKRFSDIQDDKQLLGALKLLDTSLWPTEKDSLKAFGVEALDAFVNQFSDLLESNGVDVQLLQGEWSDMKFFWFENMTQMKTYRDVWKAIFGIHRHKFPNLIHVMTVLFLYPVSNAKVERGFSAMGRVKSDWRGRLSTDVLDGLMRITLEGPDVEAFDSTPIVKNFFSTRRNPNVQPYGPRKRKSNDELQIEEEMELVD